VLQNAKLGGMDILHALVDNKQLRSELPSLFGFLPQHLW